MLGWPPILGAGKGELIVETDRDDKSARTRQGRLLRKYAIVFGALVGGSLIAGSLLQLYFSYQESQRALLKIERVEASLAAVQISEFVERMRNHILTVLPPTGLPDYSHEQRADDYKALQPRAAQISDITFIDKAGKEQVLVSRLALNQIGFGTPSGTQLVDRVQDPLFTETRSGSTYYSIVEWKGLSEPYFLIAVPERDGGVTVAKVNLRFAQETINAINAGAGGAYVVDSTGLLIVDPDTSRVLRRLDLSWMPQVQAALAAANAKSPTEQAMTAENDAGQPVLTAFELIPSTGWAVFVEQPLDEAFAPLFASLWRAGGILALGLAVSLFASLFLSRRMIEPIEAIRAGAGRIGEGALDQRIDIRTGDELEDLAEEFNQMATRLGESYATLEQKVVDRTRDLGESLERQTAIADVLKTISRSAFDLEPVLQIVLENAVRLSQADIAWMSRVEGNSFQTLAYSSGFPADLRQQIATEREQLGTEGWVPIRRAAGLVSTVVERRRLLHVADAKADPMLRDARVVRLTDARTVLGVPMLRDEQVIGTLVLARFEVRPFSEREIELVQTFADQAAIAIENIRLFNDIAEKSHEIELASKNKSEFLANMSHELRTPLNSIIGFSELLLDKLFGELNETQSGYVRDILSSGRHQLAVINDVLDMSKVEAGRLDLERSIFPLSGLVTDAVGFVRARATQRAITLTERLDAELGDVEADERKVRQVLVNLLSNAVKFSPDGGRVDVIGTRRNGEVSIAVTDSGAGISLEDQQRVFKEFGQTASARGHEGTGLGLALARRLIELHGGRIWVESAIGRGSTFGFTLPVSVPSDVPS